MSVVIEIGGREALPVRALPFVAGFDRLSPDVVALAAEGSGHFEDRALPTFRFVAGSVQPVPRFQWSFFAQSIESRSKELRAQETSPGQTKAMWQKDAVSLLPSGVFVFLEDFRDWFHRKRGMVSSCNGTMPVDDGDELELNPLVPEDLLTVLSEGFSLDGAYRQSAAHADLQQMPPTDALPPFLERSLRSAINEVVNSDRPWALLAREQLGSVAMYLDGMVVYGRRLVAFLGVRAERYDESDPGEADRIRAAQGKVQRALRAMVVGSAKRESLESAVRRFEATLLGRATEPAEAAPEQGTPEIGQGKGAPATNREREKAAPRLIAWHQAVVDHWDGMRNQYGRNPTPSEVVRFLNKHDTSGCIVGKGTEEELWWRPLRRRIDKQVSLHTVENAVTNLRKKGLIPG